MRYPRSSDQRGRGLAVGVARGDGVGRGGRGERFTVGVGDGIAAESSGWTGSARRTSGSAAVDGAGTAGVAVTVAVGVGNAGATEVGGAGVVESTGCARG